MQNDLRQLRLKAGLTQKQIAEALGVPLSTYRRWETGSSEAPKDISAKLMAIMGTPVGNVLEGSPPREPDITDDEWEDISFYGHMVVHFQGVGQPLILSLDIDEYARTYRLLQEQRKFITISSTHNETVIVRTAAVADVFFPIASMVIAVQKCRSAIWFPIPSMTTIGRLLKRSQRTK